MNTTRVVIVGGGIAGLTVAYRLLQAAVADPGPAGATNRMDISLLEAAPSFGGLIRTESAGGLVIDAGPDSLLETKPSAVELAHELGLGPSLQRTRPWRHRAFIRRGGRLHPLPDGLSGLVPGDPASWLRASMLSWPGRLRATLDLAIPAAALHGDESIADFARRRFGREAWEWLIEPLLAGIHGGEGERLGIDATFPALREAERRAGSVIRGLRTQSAPARTGPALRPAPFVAPVSGMQAFTDALVARLRGCTLRTSCSVRTVVRTDNGWRIETADAEGIDADIIVLAVPADVAATIVGGLDGRLAGLLTTIPYASSIVVHAAFPRSDVAHRLEGHGHLNPRKSGRRVAACTWTSSKFEHRAPEDRVLLRGFLKGADVAEMDDAEAMRHFREELRDALGIAAEPVHARVFRWIDRMPQYVVDHTKRVSAIEHEAGALPGFFLAGNAYHGIGIADTVASAGVVADAIKKHVADRDSRSGSRSGSRNPTGSER